MLKHDQLSVINYHSPLLDFCMNTEMSKASQFIFNARKRVGPAQGSFLGFGQSPNITFPLWPGGAQIPLLVPDKPIKQLLG